MSQAMKDKLGLAVLAMVSTLLGIVLGVQNLKADLVTKSQFEERKEAVNAQFSTVNAALKENKDELKEFRKEANEKLDRISSRLPIRD